VSEHKEPLHYYGVSIHYYLEWKTHFIKFRACTRQTIPTFFFKLENPFFHRIYLSDFGSFALDIRLKPDVQQNIGEFPACTYLSVYEVGQ
jgi:hypothetical protein